MNQELLDRLQKADPGLWEKIAETALSEYEYHDEEFNAWISNAITYTDLFGPAQEAWLQHCLQDAIRARRWGYAIGRSSKGMTSASVYVPGGEGETIMGYDDAEALLRAYLAAIQTEDKA